MTMKMVMAVVPRQEAENVMQALITAGHTATFTESRGGMLRQAQLTLFIAVEEEDLEKVLNLIKGSCHSQVTLEGGKQAIPSLTGRSAVTAKIGGAVIFVWDLEKFEIY